ncbi:MAG: hypothetical protein AAGF86_09365 [Pseudomonadota bacterium]
MRLRRTLLVLFGLGMTLPLVLFWFWLERSMVNHEVVDASERHQVIARTLGASLERYHREVKSGFQLIADNIGSDQGPSNLEAILEGLNFAHMSLVDLRSGFVDWQAGMTGPKLKAPFPADMLNMLRVYANGPDPRLSPVMRGSDGTPSLFMVKRLGTRLAIGELKTDYIVALAKSVQFGKTGHAAIVDHKGNVLAHPLDAWVQGRKNLAKLSAVKRVLNGEHGGDMFRSPMVQTDMIAGFAPVAGTGWGVMVPQSMVDLSAKAKETRTFVFLMVMFFVLLIAAIALASTTLVTGPLGTVSAAMRRLQSEGTGVRLEAPQSPLEPLEAREAREAFNALASGLEEHLARTPVRDEADVPTLVIKRPDGEAKPAPQFIHA